MPRKVSIPEYALTEPITYYVDGSSGDNSNDGLTPETAFETIGKALTVLPHFIETEAIINVTAGDYAETVAFDFDSKTGNGSIEIAGSSTWTQVGTATISSVVSNGYYHDVILNRPILDSELGLKGRFTEGFNIGSTFYIASVNPDDNTHISITKYMQTVTSRGFEILKPSTSITGPVDGGDAVTTNGTCTFILRDIHLNVEDVDGNANVRSYTGGLVTHDVCVYSGGIYFEGDAYDTQYLSLYTSAVHPYGYISTTNSKTDMLFNQCAVGCALELRPNNSSILFYTSNAGYDWEIYGNSEIDMLSAYLADTKLLFSSKSHLVEMYSCYWGAFDRTNSNTGFQFSSCETAKVTLHGYFDAGNNFITLINSGRISLQVNGTATMLDTGDTVVLYSNNLCMYNSYSDLGTTYVPLLGAETFSVVVGAVAGTTTLSSQPVGTVITDNESFNVAQVIGAL